MTKNTKLNFLVLFNVVCGLTIANSAFSATVANKSSSFSSRLSSSTSSDTSDSAIAEKIRAQRAAIDARDNQDIVAQQTKQGATSNKCDNDLRKCIESKCGSNYSQCETDSDTIFSDKLTACRKNTTCTAHEFSLFVNEIKEDKKQEIKLSSYNKVIDCGNRYNDCIITECGPTFNKCLAKSDGDKAIAKCKKIADECKTADSGMTARIGSVFGIVRTDAEKQIAADEKKLRTMRENMRKSCESLDAMFDERSLDCVFTVNFFAGEPSKLMASKKLYAGSVFDCSPDWFGIDITTFKENAYRETRAQTAASSAMLGSGVGMAVGALSSGAITRAIDTKKAKNELKDECTENGMVLDKKTGECREMTAEEQEKADKKAEKDKEKSDKKEETELKQQNCTESDGKWNKTLKTCKCPDDKILDTNNGECRDPISGEQTKATKKSEQQKTDCTKGRPSGKWENNACVCPNGFHQSSISPYYCIAGKSQAEKDKAKTEKEKQKEQENKCKDSGGTFKNDTCTCPLNKKLNANKDACDSLSATTICSNANATGNHPFCRCKQSTQKYDTDKYQCIEMTTKEKCTFSGGEYKNKKCDCSKANKILHDSGLCVNYTPTEADIQKANEIIEKINNPMDKSVF